MFEPSFLLGMASEVLGREQRGGRKTERNGQLESTSLREVNETCRAAAWITR